MTSVVKSAAEERLFVYARSPFWNPANGSPAVVARSVVLGMEGERRLGRRPQAWKGTLLVGALVFGGCAQAHPAAATVVGPVATADRQAEPTITPSPLSSPTPEPVVSIVATAQPTSTAPAVATVTSPVPSTPAQPRVMAGVRLTRLPTGSNVVALTFDAGANADGVPSILRTLQATGTPATFFLTGKWVQTYPQLAQQIGRHYQVGNHTFSHPHLPLLSDPAVNQEIVSAGTVIAGASGHDPRPLFRFPYGDGDARTIAIANHLGYSCIQWTVDTKGWKGMTSGQSVDSVVSRVTGSLQPGEIVLMHVGSAEDGSTLDADSLPRIIAALHAQGYAFTTVGDAI